MEELGKQTCRILIALCFLRLAWKFDLWSFLSFSMCVCLCVCVGNELLMTENGKWRRPRLKMEKKHCTKWKYDRFKWMIRPHFGISNGNLIFSPFSSTRASTHTHNSLLATLMYLFRRKKVKFSASWNMSRFFSSRTEKVTREKRKSWGNNKNNNNNQQASNLKIAAFSFYLHLLFSLLAGKWALKRRNNEKELRSAKCENL